MVSLRRISERVYSPDAYLALERAAEFKSELYHGHIVAMAGSTPEHSAITANLAGALFVQLAATPCQVFSSGMKVRTTHGCSLSLADIYRRIRFPDATVSSADEA